MGSERYWTDKDLSTPREEWAGVAAAPSNNSPSYYNSEHFYNGQYPGMSDSTPSTTQSYSEIEAEIKRKKTAESKRLDSIAKHMQYEESLERMRDAKRQQEIDQRLQEEQRRKEEEDYQRTREKNDHILEAKERYKRLSPFTKLFVKKIDLFRRGIGYYNPDNMTNDQIDSLYGGKSR